MNRVLVIRTDRIGEVLLSTPILGSLKIAYPDASISVMVKPHIKELIEGNPNVNEIISYEDLTEGFREAFKLKRIIREKNFDLAVIVNPKKKFHLACFLAGVPVRVGFNRKWGFLLTHKVADEKSKAQKHEVEYNLDLLRALKIEPKDKRPIVIIDDRQQVPDVPEKAVAIHPATSNPKKRWEAARFAQLGDIFAKLGYAVIFVGGKEEAEECHNVMSLMKAKPINLTGKTSLKELAAVLKKCLLLVSNDSGPVHISAAVGTPVIALFGKADPGSRAKRWGPYGEGHQVIEKDRLEDIAPEEVFATAAAMLKSYKS